jgi:hypothetical protein
VKVNLLSPDIYEIEDFVSIEEQEEVLQYCANLDESEWWKTDYPGHENSFFFGKQKLGELPKVFDSITTKSKDLFRGYMHFDPVSLQRHPSGNFMQAHKDYWKKDADYHIRFGMVIYYNDDYVGGEIEYPDLGIIHKPKARSLLMHGGNILHGTTEVTSDGYRYFSTSFIRGNIKEPVILNPDIFADVEQSDGSIYS